MRLRPDGKRAVHNAGDHVASWVRSYVNLANLPADSAGVREAKGQWMLIIAFLLPYGCFVAALYFAYGEALVGSIALGVTVISMLINTLLFALVHRNVIVAYFIAAISVLAGTTLASFSLGSFYNASGSILIDMFLVVLSGRYASYALALYSLIIAALLTLQPFPRASTNLPPEVISGLWVANITIGVAMVLLCYRFAVRQRNRSHSLLRAEQEKSDGLLLNILPQNIAALLKAKPNYIADRFENVTILFADLVDFTQISAAMEPGELVALLNEVFSDFDELADRYGLEKIKTIGDCYMVAAGVPRPTQAHAVIMMRMALEMQAVYASRSYLGRKLSFRIGINSGPVVAGVIGRKKFSYDLWGDTVNVASRMESQGCADAIQITRATYDLVKDHFTCEARGSVTIKGKGEMDVWHIVSDRSEPQQRDVQGRHLPCGH